MVSLTFFCISLVRLRRKFPYHLDNAVTTGTEIKAIIDSCHDMTNIKMRTPIAWTTDLKKTLTFRVTWSPTSVVSLLRRLVISPVFVVSKKPTSE